MGVVKGAREAFKVNEEALNDDGKTLKGDEEVLKGNGEACIKEWWVSVKR